MTTRKIREAKRFERGSGRMKQSKVKEKKEVNATRDTTTTKTTMMMMMI
jgi:hypothetical protein